MKKIIIALLCVLALVSALPMSAAAEESGTRVHSILENAVEHNGNYYLLIDWVCTWEEAARICELLGGHLATVTDAEENRVCREYWQASGLEACYLGASDADFEGNWQWVTGEPWTYSDFGTGEPNGGTDENVLNYYGAYESGSWNDNASGTALPFLCEWEAADVGRVRGEIGYMTSPNVLYNNSLYFKGHLYKLYTHEANYQSAMQYCERLGGHPVSIESKNENDMLYLYVCAFGAPNCMLGGTDSGSEGLWYWSTGESFTYSNWAEGEPNNQDDEGRLCFTADGRWNDIDWNETYGFLCEWDDPCISGGAFSESHSFGAGEEIYTATCTQEGEILSICERCGARSHKTVEKLPHEFGEWEVKTPATCHADGVNIRGCLHCDLTEEEPSEQLTHIYTEYEVVRGSVLIPPIVKEKTCTLCHDVQTQEDWSYVWVTVLAAVAAVGVVIGVIGYFRAFRKK